jgi:hypothetical protein
MRICSLIWFKIIKFLVFNKNLLFVKTSGIYLYVQEHSPTNHNNYYISSYVFTNSKFLIKTRNFTILNQIRLQILMKFKERIFIYFI